MKLGQIVKKTSFIVALTVSAFVALNAISCQGDSRFANEDAARRDRLEHEDAAREAVRQIYVPVGNGGALSKANNGPTAERKKMYDLAERVSHAVTDYPYESLAEENERTVERIYGQRGR